eukprot:6188496-Pleurochrysis_carterae.AAC.1
MRSKTDGSRPTDGLTFARAQTYATTHSHTHTSAQAHARALAHSYTHCTNRSTKRDADAILHALAPTFTPHARRHTHCLP